MNASIFSRREHRIAKLVVEGLTNKQAARKMGLTHHYFKNLMRPMYDKSGMSSRLELALWYLHHFPGVK